MDYSRSCAKIDLSAITHNFQEIKNVIKEDTRVVAVIKADGYGHGAVPIAKRIENLDYIWGFATATVPEAMILRQNGIKKPILILGYSFENELEDIVLNNIRPAVFTYEYAKTLSELAVKNNSIVNIHIKTDTGMGRIGYQVEPESIEEIKKISQLPGLNIEGIFTHFSKADEIDKGYANYQIDNFNKMIEMCQKAGIEIPLKHCSNSAGIIELPGVNMNLVRAGIIIYGLWPSDEVARDVIDLKPVMEIKSRIVHIKELKEDSLISYGGTYHTKAGDVIATVSFGYADGYPRGLSNKGYVLVRGKKAPIIGRICMDQFMINVKDIPDVQLLDEVTLVGRDGEEIITMEELGDISGRFNYEFACDIGGRVPRIYLE